MTSFRAKYAVALTAAFAFASAAPTGAQVTSSDTSAIRAGQLGPAAVKHTVKRGDTLWDIAKFYLKDPFKWPQVFHANTNIVKNPHWIYPGQILTIDGGAVKPEIAARADDRGFVASEIQTRAASQTVFARSGMPVTTPNVATIAPPPALTVRRGEYEAAPYVVDSRHPTGAGKVLGAVETLALGLHSDAGFRFNDRLYITSPAGAAPAIGTRFVIARSNHVLPDIGRVIEPTGIVRVDSIGAKGILIATLIQQYGSVVPDQLVLPIGQSFEATTQRPSHGTYLLATTVQWIQDSPALPSTQTYVVLGLNGSQGVHAGDQFTLYDDAPSAAIAATPQIASATVTVVRVTPFGVSALIVDQTQPHIHEGMPARLTAKMP